MRGAIHSGEQFSKDNPPQEISIRRLDSSTPRNDPRDEDRRGEPLPSDESGQPEFNRGFEPHGFYRPGESNRMNESQHRNSQKRDNLGKAGTSSAREGYGSRSNPLDDFHRLSGELTGLTYSINSRLAESRLTEALRRRDLPSNGFQFSSDAKLNNLVSIPPPKATSLQASIQYPTEPVRLNLTVLEKFEARLGQEATLKVTAAEGYNFQQISLQDLILGLGLPNLLRIEQRNTAVYLRLLDSTTAHRIASECRNHNSLVAVGYQRALKTVTISHPADYAPRVTADTMALYQSGARRILCTPSFQPEYQRSEAEYDGFVVAARRLVGYFSLIRTSAGKVFIGFDGIENAVDGKKVLEKKFDNVILRFVNEKGSGEW